MSQDGAEAPTTTAILKDGLAALAILLTAFAVEAVARLLFPAGVPLVPNILLTISDIAMILAFCIPTVRLAKTLLRLVFGERKGLSSASVEGRVSLLVGALKVYRTALGAGMITGAIVASLLLVLILLAWAPWWVRFTIFVVGLLVIIAGIAAAMTDVKSARSNAAASGGGGIAVFLILLIPGLFFMALAFGGQVEDWTAFSRSIVDTVLRLRPG
jgi:hypothetical protein